MLEDKYWIEFTGITQIGSNHERIGIGNQDAIQCLPSLEKRGYGSGYQIACAVADGHGSAKSFRSDVGAQIAVDVAIQLANYVISNSSKYGEHFSIKHSLEHGFPLNLLSQWRKKVDEHLAENPIKDSEKQKVIDLDGIDALEMIKENPYIIYGTTLLLYIINQPYFQFFLQIGDGSIYILSSDKKLIKPFPDDDLIGNETYSLCLPNAEQYFRTSYKQVKEDLMVFLTTDGLVNSFETDEAVEGFIRYIYDFNQNYGIDKSSEQLKIWAKDISLRGSGDDVTMVFAVRKISNYNEGLDFYLRQYYEVNK